MGRKKKNHRYRNFGISCPYPVDNKELTPFWSLFLKKSEPPGFWPRWGYLAFNFASSTFSGLITLSSISWKTISNTVNEIYNSELFMQNTFAGNSPTCWLLLPSEYTNYFNKTFSYILSWIPTATIGVQPPILDTFPGDVFESNQCISLSHKSGLY